jgi:hypothetical protein
LYCGKNDVSGSLAVELLPGPECVALVVEFIAAGLLLVDLRLELLDDAEQVQFDHVVLELVVLVLELPLETLDVQLRRQEAALGPVVLDVLE